ncbi:MAG: hypothetical protein KKF65_02525 [Nanoarchaeota archaeon]|nr:hypothetical protein [Nanoarchaeota archaeon]
MKKLGGVLLIFLLMIFVINFAVTVQAENESDSDVTSTSDEVVSETSSGDYDSSVSVDSSSREFESLGNLSKAFDCLEEKAGAGCKDVDSVQEIALTIMATPDNIMKGCVEKLKTKRSGNNFGSIRDTALAVIALNHAGEDTEAIEKWLLERRQNPTDIIWFLQEDSDGEVECTIDDGSLRY